MLGEGERIQRLNLVFLITAVVIVKMAVSL